MKKVLCAFLTACMTFYIAGALLFGGATAFATGDFTFDAATGTITKYVGAGGEVTVPDIIGGVSVERIGDSAFLNCVNVTSVTLPDSVEAIGNYAFYRMSKLTSVHMGAGLTNIGSYAFANCSALTGAVLPDGVTLIDSYAFSNCFGLTGVIIPNSVITIGDGVFYNCIKLADLTIGSGVTTIGAQAFSSCKSLTVVNMPAKVTSIGFCAFAPCDLLRQINVEGANPNYCSQDGVLFNKAKTTLIQYPTARTGAYVVPDSVNAIETYAFWKCAGLTGITMTDNVKSIGVSAFSECIGLTGVDLPTKLTAISATTFYGCSNLLSITIPYGVTSIGADAFSCCSRLAEVSIPNTVTTLGETVFYNCTSLITVNIPASVTKIGSYVFSNCSKLASAYFYGDAPVTFGGSVFESCAANFKVYYLAGAKNFTVPTWKGYLCASFQTITALSISAPPKINQIRGSIKPVTFTAVPTPDVVNPNTVLWYVNGEKQDKQGLVFTFTATDADLYEITARVSDNPDAIVDTKILKVLDPAPVPQVTADDIMNVIIGLDLETMEYAVSTDGGTTYGEYTSSAVPELSGDKTVKVRVRENDEHGASQEVVLTFTVNTHANGDVNDDGIIDISDVVMAGEIALGSSSYTPDQIARSNVCDEENPTVDIADVIFIAEVAVSTPNPNASKPQVLCDDIENVIIGLNLQTMEYAVSTDGGATFDTYRSDAPPKFGGSKVVKVRIKAVENIPAGMDAVLIFTPNYGDVDGNGEIDIADVVLAAEIAVGDSSCTEEQKLRGNVNSKTDKTVDISDVILIAERAVGGDVPFEVELP